MMTAAVLAIDGLSKSYDEVVALDRVSLKVEAGEVVGLLGPNGAGKTTLVSIICGLRRADSGSVTVRGVDALARPDRARRHIGFAPQDLGIYPIDTVRQNLTLFGELRGLRGNRLITEVGAVADALRLGDLMGRKAAELSGGQKRRLHTAIALLDHPDLILLDEATTGADVETRAALIELVGGLAAKGSAVVYSTHYLQEVEALASRVAILERGRMLADGSVDGLVARNGGAFVELVFDGSPPVVRGRWDVTVEGNVIRVAVDDPGRAIGPLLDSMGPGSKRVKNVALVTPSLESVFLTLTGRRYRPEEERYVVAS